MNGSMKQRKLNTWKGVVTVGMAVAIVATTAAFAPTITPSVYTRIGDGVVWIT